MSRLRLFIIILLVAGSAVACTSTGRVTESQKAVASISETANQLNVAQTKVDKIVASIDELSSRTVNMQSAFTAYSKDVADIQAARQKAQAQRDAMQANSRDYIAKWQMELETMQDPDVKSALTKRKEKVASSFEQIRSSLDELTEAYQPFLTNISAIRKALAVDLNPSGVQSLEPAMKKAKEQAQTVKEKLVDVRQELDEIAGSMSPTMAAK